MRRPPFVAPAAVGGVLGLLLLLGPSIALAGDSTSQGLGASLGGGLKFGASGRVYQWRQGGC